MDSHNKSFFGQKTGIIVSSPNKHEDFIYFRFLKKKNNGSWEKPSNKEGTTIKFNLGEIIQIINVLEKGGEWKTVHRFHENNTSITFKTQNNGISIFIPGYSKPLKFPDTIILKDLLQHIYKEKIIYSTGNTGNRQFNEKFSQNSYKNTSKKPVDNEGIGMKEDFFQDQQNEALETQFISKPKPISNTPTSNKPLSYINPDAWISNLQTDETKEHVLLPGEILQKTDKAISFQVNGLNSLWIPLSQTKDVELADQIGGLWAKSWIIKRNLDKIFTT